MRKLVPFLLALVSTLALAGGPGPAPFNSGSQQIFDASSSATTPNYLGVNSDGSINVKAVSGGASQNVNIHDAAGTNLVSGGGFTDTGALNITPVDNYSTGTVTTTGGSNFTLTTNGGVGTCKILVTGTWTGTLTTQGSVDGTNFTNINLEVLPGAGSISTSFSSNATFVVDGTGFKAIRVNGPTSTGTANIAIDCASLTSSFRILQPLPSGTNSIGQVNGGGSAGTPNAGVLSIQGITSMTPVQVSTPVVTAANILVGRQTFGSTTGATTLITIPAGRTWAGTLESSVSCNSAAANATACQANAAFTTVGAGTTPAPGNYFVCDTKSGANSATGTVGSQGSNNCSVPMFVNCASGTCTVAVTATIAGTTGLVEATASGQLQ